jgi:hypothetical protein
MERKLTPINPFYAATTVMLALTAVVAGCGGGTKGDTAGRPSGSTRQADYPLAKSHLRVLTKLHRSQLCSVLSAAEARGILHAPAAAPVYTHHPGVAITCQWIKRGQRGTSREQLYVSIPASINWTGTQAVDRTLHGRAVTIDGHPALAATRLGTGTWAQVDVALGGGDDPVAEYRAPTLAAARALATAATPHIMALG